MTTTTDLFARGANLAPPPRRGSGAKDPTTALDNIPPEGSSTHSTAATHPPTARRKRCSACSTCPSDAQDASIVVPSDYALPDLTLDLLAAIVVKSATKGAKTEAA